jgi:GntR family transcriptional repressor for pyruvate dehydrogenase complex
MTTDHKFQTVARPPIYVQVADQIRSAILERSLASGERLPPERVLSQQFGVSRATVREALRHLEAQGLLASKGRTSPMQTASPEGAISRFCEALTHVVRLRSVSLPDLVELRLAIESAALVRAAASPVDACLDMAREALATMAGDDVGAEAFYAADAAFHAALVAASGNQALHLIMLAVKDSIGVHIAESLDARTFAKIRGRLIREHEALLRAVEAGHGKSAVAHLRKHLSFYAT